jgi:hypothetical protein
MKTSPLFAALLIAAPLAQAHTPVWSRLLADPAGQSLNLAAVRGVATSPQETAVLVRRSGAGLAPAAVIHALSTKGGDLPWTVTYPALQPTAPFEPQRVDISGGNRVGLIEENNTWGARNTIVTYAAGQDQQAPLAGTQLPRYAGFRIYDLRSDGGGGWFVAYDDPSLSAQPWLLWGLPREQAPGGIRWGRSVPGCEQSAALPTELVALDTQFAAPARITVLTRCLGTAAQGGGAIAVHTIEPLNGQIMSSRYSPLYGAAAAPVIAAEALGDGRFVVDQATAAGTHTLRIVGLQSDSAPLPLPPGFRVHRLVRTPAGVLAVAADPLSGSVGTLFVETAGAAVRWAEYPSVSDVDVADLHWSGDAAGRVVAAYRDADGNLTLVGLDRDGGETWRRLVESVSAPVGATIQFAPGAANDEVVFAVDVLLRDGSAGVYVEQMGLESDLGSIPWPAHGVPLHGRPD